MPFQCPQCQDRSSLDITHSLQIPPDSRSDDIALQVVGCRACGFRGIAVYEESRRGRLDVEAWEHTGYRVSEKDLNAIVEGIKSCIEPMSARCQCPFHRHIGRKDIYGRWVGMDAVQRLSSFRMRLAV